MLVAGIIAVVASFMLLKMGYGSLRDSPSHRAYGVDSESLHRSFARILITVGWILGAAGAYLMLAGVFG